MTDQNISGYLANDPKMVTTSSGQQLAVFKVMENNRFYDRQAQQWRDGAPTTYDVAVGNEQLRANVLASLQKGQRVQIEGNHQTKAYLDRSGNPQVGHQVWANDVAASYMHQTQQRGEPAPTVSPDGPARDGAQWGEPQRGAGVEAGGHEHAGVDPLTQQGYAGPTGPDQEIDSPEVTR